MKSNMEDKCLVFVYFSSHQSENQVSSFSFMNFHSSITLSNHIFFGLPLVPVTGTLVVNIILVKWLFTFILWSLVPRVCEGVSGGWGYGWSSHDAYPWDPKLDPECRCCGVPNASPGTAGGGTRFAVAAFPAPPPPRDIPPTENNINTR